MQLGHIVFEMDEADGFHSRSFRHGCRSLGRQSPIGEAKYGDAQCNSKQVIGHSFFSLFKLLIGLGEAATSPSVSSGSGVRPFSKKNRCYTYVGDFSK